MLLLTVAVVVVVVKAKRRHFFDFADCDTMTELGFESELVLLVVRTFQTPSSLSTSLPPSLSLSLSLSLPLSLFLWCICSYGAMMRACTRVCILDWWIC
jgi:hypothetical protein